MLNIVRASGLAMLSMLVALDVSAEPKGMASQLIKQLHMEKIPAEGAWFAATYRSEDSLAPDALPKRYGGVARAMGSAIYALVTVEDFSAMHRLRTDEIWHYYSGNALEMLLLYPDGHGETVVLGPDVLHGQRPQVVVKAGVWQGARPLAHDAHSYTLFGDTLTPGFDYADFTSGYRDELQKAYPRYAGKIADLTREEFARKP